MHNLEILVVLQVVMPCVFYFVLLFRFITSSFQAFLLCVYQDYLFKGFYFIFFKQMIFADFTTLAVMFTD